MLTFDPYKVRLPLKHVSGFKSHKKVGIILTKINNQAMKTLICIKDKSPDIQKSKNPKGAVSIPNFNSKNLSGNQEISFFTRDTCWFCGKTIAIIAAVKGIKVNGIVTR